MKIVNKCNFVSDDADETSQDVGALLRFDEENANIQGSTVTNKANFLTHHLEAGTSKAEAKNNNSLLRGGQLWSTDLEFMSENCQTEPYLQIWDPVGQICYNLSCGIHFEAKDGGCYFRNVTNANLVCNSTSEMQWWQFR